MMVLALWEHGFGALAFELDALGWCWASDGVRLTQPSFVCWWSAGRPLLAVALEGGGGASVALCCCCGLDWPGGMGLWRSSAGCASRAGHPEAAAGGTGGGSLLLSAACSTLRGPSAAAALGSIAGNMHAAAGTAAAVSPPASQLLAHSYPACLLSPVSLPALAAVAGLAARALCALPALLHAAQHPAPPPAARAGAGPAAGAGLGAGAAKQRRSTAACRVPGLAPVQRQLQADLRSSAVSRCGAAMCMHAI